MFNNRWDENLFISLKRHYSKSLFNFSICKIQNQDSEIASKNSSVNNNMCATADSNNIAQPKVRWKLLYLFLLLSLFLRLMNFLNLQKLKTRCSVVSSNSYANNDMWARANTLDNAQKQVRKNNLYLSSSWNLSSQYSHNEQCLAPVNCIQFCQIMIYLKTCLCICFTTNTVTVFVFTLFVSVSDQSDYQIPDSGSTHSSKVKTKK